MKSFKKKRQPASITRSMPFIKILITSQKKDKIELLKRFPSYVIDDISEILVNIVKGNVKSTKNHVKKLRPYKTQLTRLMRLKDKRKRRNFIYKQKGGFLAGVLPVATSLLLSLIGSNVLS